jgi:hypothetical protein
MLTDADVAHFHARLRDLSGDATDWILEGRRAL